jgi:prophage antirepressor-like protein
MIDTNQPQGYAIPTAPQWAGEISLSNVNRGHTAHSRFFCVQKSMARLWAGCVELRKQRQLRFTGKANPHSSAHPISLGRMDKTTLNRIHAMTNPTQATPVINQSIFNFQSNSVRTYLDDNSEPWFCAKDVCDILGYANDTDAIKKHCKTPWVAKRYLGVETGLKADGHYATQQVAITFINESNLYRLIIKSRKPEAERFEAWIMEEVLPRIRKTGNYQLTAPKPSMDNELLDMIDKHSLELTLKYQKKIRQQLIENINQLATENEPIKIGITNYLNKYQNCYEPVVLFGHELRTAGAMLKATAETSMMAWEKINQCTKKNV